MTAEPIATERYDYVPVDAVFPSDTNPRTKITDDSVAELAQSVAERGIIEPLVVHDLGKKGFRIVAGERRWRAAKLAKLATVPVIIRPLIDEKDTRLVQLVENIQREDLQPLQLAKAYEQLRKDFGLSADDIATMVKRKRRTVYATLQLLQLSGEPKKALEKGEISASVAALLARVPEKRREAGLKALREKAPYIHEQSNYLRDPSSLSVRAAEGVLRDFIGQKLDRVPWKLDDATLVPDQGPCTTCEFNTRNVPDLAEIYGDADICISAEGFKRKTDASFKRDQAAAEAKGMKALSPAESKKLTKYGYFEPRQSGYAALTEAIPGEDRTYADALKGSDAQVYLGRGPKGGQVKLVKLAEVKPHLKAAGVRVADEPSRSAPTSKEDTAKREQEKEIRAAAEREVVLCVYERGKKVKLTVGLIPILLRGELPMLNDVVRAVAEIIGVVKPDADFRAATKWAEGLKDAELLPVYLAGVANEYLDYDDGAGDALFRYAGLPPLKELLAKAITEVKAKMKAEAKAVPAKPKAAKQAKKVK